MVERKAEVYSALKYFHSFKIIKIFNEWIKSTNKGRNRHFMFVGSPTEGKKRENTVFVKTSPSESSVIEKCLLSFGFATIKEKKRRQESLLSSPSPHLLEACRCLATNDSTV